MRPRHAGLLLLLLAVLAVPAAAHGNYVAADAQVSDDGTVRVELVVLVTDGHLVLHANDGGEPGPVIGHRELGDGFVHADIPMQIDPAFWANKSGNMTIWAVLHGDDGDETFDTSEDPPLNTTTNGSVAAAQFIVGKHAGGGYYVGAEADHGQETGTNTVQVRRVELATDGYLVVRADQDGEAGHTVGSRSLASGIHENVTVKIDEGFYEHRPERFMLWAALHRSDGDAAFEPDADQPVTVGDSMVMTRFAVHRTDEIEHTPTDAGGETATGTEEDAHDHEHTHTESGDHDGTDDQTTSAGSHSDGHAHDDGSHDHGTPRDESSVTTPGFGIVIAVLALVAMTLLAIARRR